MAARDGRFVLLMGPDDWSPLKDTGLSWDDAWGGVSLQPLFYRSQPDDGQPAPVEGRLGAARSRSGAWYWIGANRAEIWVREPGAAAPHLFWPLPEHGLPSAPFRPVKDPGPLPSDLLGLAVTTGDYLVAGLPGEGCLLVFDLLAQNSPVRVRWPGAFAPAEMAAAPDGGLVILDVSAQQHRIWTLDRGLRITGSPLALPPDLRALGVELLPDGSLLVLGAPGSEGASVIVRFRNGQEIGQCYLSIPKALIEPAVVIKDMGSSTVAAGAGRDPGPFSGLVFYPTPGLPAAAAPAPLSKGDRPIRAYDLAFTPAEPGPDQTADLVCGTLYAVTGTDDQAYAFSLEASDSALSLRLLTAYLPLYRSHGRGLAAAGGEVFYDCMDDWVLLQEEARPRYVEAGQFTSARAFDGHQPDCIWHRAFLDAAIPPGASVVISTRCSNDPTFADARWLEQPAPYRRPNGSELPYHAPFPAGAPEFAGTWELLLQRAAGRYLQVRVTLTGTGRNSPRLHALRIYSPRFSYVTEYLPDLYQASGNSFSFLERYLANPEGILTDLETRIDHVDLLFDPRSAPAEYLDWLASWFGIILETQWEEARRRLFLEHALELFRTRGTLPGLVRSLRLATDPFPDEALFTDDISPYTGDVTAPPLARPAFRIIEGAADGSPHLFTIYITVDTQGLMLDPVIVQRVAEAAKPAHTQFIVAPYWGMFRVGGARLGLDTVLTESGRLAGLVLGQTALADGYLASEPPWSFANRAVVGRDQIQGKSTL